MSASTKPPARSALYFLGRRLALALPVAFAVATLIFALLHLVPGDPAEMMLGEGARAADIASLREKLGLNRPLLEQYSSFLSGLLRGDLGRSLAFERPVSELLLGRLPATLELASIAMLLALAFALPLGIVAAVRQGWIDHTSRALALVGVSVPSFWLGPMLILVFAIRLDWLPVSGRAGLASVILPAITLGAAQAALLTRMMRASLAGELDRPYLLAARAKGLSRLGAVLKHAVRNALIPVVTVMGMQFGALMTGSIITETIFAWPGLGRLLVQAIQLRDYPLVQGCVLLIAGSHLLANLCTDLLCGWLDPRVRAL